MAISKEKKKEILEKLNSLFSDSESVVFVNFHGLSVSDISGIRKDFKSKDIDYFVAKKTLAKMAMNSSGLEGEVPELEGEVAFVYGKDALAPAREVYSFQSKHPENFRILGGVFERSIKNKEEMVEMASIPTIDILYGKFVNVINSPIQALAIVLNEVAKKREA